MAEQTLTAEPYTARRCPTCDTWIVVDRPPYAEGGDPTKTLRDVLHQARHHDADVIRDDVGIPYFPWNTEPVEAVLEEVWT